MFWEEHKCASTYPNLQRDDFESLVRSCLLDDCYLHSGHFKKQLTGIAMGNNAAPPFAVIFMNFIEMEILAKNQGKILFWKRYIDDIFFVSSLSFEQILLSSNSVSTSIKFTLEKPVNQEIPFLDVSLRRSESNFEYEVYIKPTHSNSCLPYDSFVLAY